MFSFPHATLILPVTIMTIQYYTLEVTFFAQNRPLCFQRQLSQKLEFVSFFASCHNLKVNNVKE